MILGPIVLGGLIIGGAALAFVLAVGSGAAMREWVRMMPPHAADWRRDALVGVAVTTIVVAAVVGQGLAIALLIGAGLLVAAAGRWPWIGFGLPYVCLASLATLWLRAQPEMGLALVLFAVLAIWATDIGAYIAGRAIGGGRLWPRISPNKTWAGTMGGIVLAALVGGAVAVGAGAQHAWLAPIVAALVSIAAQLGDLFESAMKRRVGRKDSGGLIPGHGGVLDRVDGLLSGLPVFAVLHMGLQSTIQWWSA